MSIFFVNAAESNNILVEQLFGVQSVMSFGEHNFSPSDQELFENLSTKLITD